MSKLIYSRLSYHQFNCPRSLKIDVFTSSARNPNIKIQILICCPYTFPIKVVGRICWSINYIYLVCSMCSLIATSPMSCKIMKCYLHYETWKPNNKRRFVPFRLSYVCGERWSFDSSPWELVVKVPVLCWMSQLTEILIDFANQN